MSVVEVGCSVFCALPSKSVTISDRKSYLWRVSPCVIKAAVSRQPAPSRSIITRLKMLSGGAGVVVGSRDVGEQKSHVAFQVEDVSPLKIVS